MADPNRYEIRTFSDMLEIPDGSLDDFLIDLKGAIISAKAMKQMIDAVVQKRCGDDTLEPVKLPESFTFIDDGRHDMKVKFENVPARESDDHEHEG